MGTVSERNYSKMAEELNNNETTEEKLKLQVQALQILHSSVQYLKEKLGHLKPHLPQKKKRLNSFMILIYSQIYLAQKNCQPRIKVFIFDLYNLTIIIGGILSFSSN